MIIGSVAHEMSEVVNGQFNPKSNLHVPPPPVVHHQTGLVRDINMTWSLRETLRARCEKFHGRTFSFLLNDIMSECRRKPCSVPKREARAHFLLCHEQ